MMTVKPSTRQELVNQVAGLLSTIEFRPSEGHPIALDLYADQIVSMCDTRLQDIADAWNEYKEGPHRMSWDNLVAAFEDALSEEADDG